MEVCVMADVTSLLNAEAMSEKLKNIVSADRLLELASCGMVPHYDVDGNVMFGPGETKEWLNHNLVVRKAGRHLGNSILTVVDVMAPSKSRDSIPLELSAIAGMLIPLSIQSAESVGLPGVYFLCHEGAVVYVGQSVNVFGRVGAHIGVKTFDSVWFVRVPQSDLDFVEGQLIRTLKPKYNHDKKGRIIAPGTFKPAECDESIQCVAAVAGWPSEESDGH
jgi:hypothetical protein